MAIGLDVRSALTENLYLKFLSFALALLLYSSFHGTQDAQRSISVNLLLVMPQDSGNRVLVSPVPETLRLTLRGPRSALDELRAQRRFQGLQSRLDPDGIAPSVWRFFFSPLFGGELAGRESTLVVGFLVRLTRNSIERQFRHHHALKR